MPVCFSYELQTMLGVIVNTLTSSRFFYSHVTKKVGNQPNQNLFLAVFFFLPHVATKFGVTGIVDMLKWLTYSVLKTSSRISVDAINKV